jgi:hypothetical protein
MRSFREALIARIEQQTERTSTAWWLDMLKKMQCTYLKRTGPHFQLLAAMQGIAESCESEGRLTDAVEWFEKIFELSRNYNDYMAIKTLRSIYRSLVKMGDKQRGKKGERCRKQAYDLFGMLRFHGSFSDHLWKKYFLEV